MTRVTHLLGAATRRLGSRLEAELLVSAAVERPRTWLYGHGEEIVQPVSEEILDQLLLRRLNGEPMAYILGRREFYGRNFLVSPGVLIPRPETELVVELTLQRLGRERRSVVDVGTGSGCIALTLAAERPSWQVTAVDFSSDALQTCAANAQQLGLRRVRLVKGDLLATLPDRRFDAIVSNPPYVAEDDRHLSQGDLRFEPMLALSAGQDGLAVIRRLVRQAPLSLKPGAWLIVEHGYDQGAMVRDLMSRAGFAEIETHRDLAGIDRVTLARH